MAIKSSQCGGEMNLHALDEAVLPCVATKAG